MTDIVYTTSAVVMETRMTNAVLFGQVLWNGKPVIDDDDGGTAGVREPRRPHPPTLSPMAMELALI